MSQLISLIRELALQVTGNSNEAERMKKHDALHLEVAALPRIIIKGHLVNGIDGIPIPEFFPLDYDKRRAAYDGMLDEFRVHTHAFLTAPSIYAVGRFIYNCYLMASQGINPIEVLYAHSQSMQ